MATTQLSQQNGESTIFDAKPSVNVPRSKFDLSRKNMFTGDIGMIMPIDLIPTVPGDDFKISLQHIIDTFPLVVPPMTRYRVRTHWYYSDCNSLWKGWQTFITKGRSGSISTHVPSISFYGLNVSGDPNSPSEHSLTNGLHASDNGPMSLTSFFGLPPILYQGASPTKPSGANLFGNYLPFVYRVGTEGTDFFKTGFSMFDSYNALPFMMYQKIFRHNYLANNLLQNNKVWFPDDLQDEWRISFNADNLLPFTSGGHSALFTPTALPSGTTPASLISNYIPISDSSSLYMDKSVNLGHLRYAMYDNDYFTSARPWLVRGSETELSSIVDISGLDFAEISALLGFSTSSHGPFTSGSLQIVPSGSASSTQAKPVTWQSHSNGSFEFGMSSDTSVPYISVPKIYVFPQSGYSTSSGNFAGVTFTPSASGSVTGNVHITANTLRSLLALSVWQERNAVTNGNYNEYVKVHFNINPKKPDYEPLYIGGTSDIIQFADIIQTSQSTADSPLGTQGGLGHSQASGYVGSFHCSDYGYIMGVMIITPETTYVQGAEHWQFDLNQEDYYCPEFANLSYQAILNKQVYVSGDSTIDNDLFGYSNRYIYMKTRDSVVRGMFSLPSSSDLIFSAYSQSRIFTETPKLSYQFCVMSPYNTRRDWLMYPAQPAFKIQLGLDVQAVRPLPYLSQPETFGF